MLIALVLLVLIGVSPAQEPGAAAAEAGSPTAPEPTVWNLAVQGGLFMIPIAIASVVVVAFTIERFIGLRTNRILRPELLSELKRLNSDARGLDPRAAYRLCQQHKSPLANIIRAAVLKLGRPHSEVEKSVEDAVAREATDMSANIRPINVSASISPLLGLLGTVQGMILAFMVTSTTSATGAAKAQELAQGIYTALVTTFAGLCVAVVAVLFANYLEGRIERLLREMEEIFLDILPQFERFEGKTRVTRKAPAQRPFAESSSKVADGNGKGTAAPAPSHSNMDEADLPVPEEEPALAEAVAGPKGLWGIMGGQEQSQAK